MKKSGSREKAVEDGRSVEKKQCGQKKVRSLKTLRHQKGDDEGRAHVVNKAQKIRGFLRGHPPVSCEIRQHLGPHGKAAEETDEAGIASQRRDAKKPPENRGQKRSRNMYQTGVDQKTGENQKRQQGGNEGAEPEI